MWELHNDIHIRITTDKTQNEYCWVLDSFGKKHIGVDTSDRIAMLTKVKAVSIKKLIEELISKEVYQHISKLIGKDLKNSYVRVEVICDREGFWLKPHCDIEEKLLSSLIFVNPFNESEDLGTDFYNEKLTKVKTVPYKNNYGYFFTSGPNTWHGMEKKKINKERRCLQINYVSFETDWKVKS